MTNAQLLVFAALNGHYCTLYKCPKQSLDRDHGRKNISKHRIGLLIDEGRSIYSARYCVRRTAKQLTAMEITQITAENVMEPATTAWQLQFHSFPKKTAVFSSSSTARSWILSPYKTFTPSFAGNNALTAWEKQKLSLLLTLTLGTGRSRSTSTTEQDGAFTISCTV